ncbi:hypothetical protein O0S08_26525 [Nannocystis poenicansa]|uniref:Uncharacterized protein n=1 Tax=Nannocystis punicea TaxID=2995304 RepID=A0ABY7GS54_9BACT|nr:hypothetical protein [Nannocystis poenicansa]WAS89764.1 hypothetical protein O0S08_26525 [Nannocystis poenicansa]
MLLAAPARGDALSPYAAEHDPFFSTLDFSTTPALVVAGDKDGSPHLTTAGGPEPNDRAPSGATSAAPIPGGE